TLAVTCERRDIDLRLLAAAGLEEGLADQLQKIAVTGLVLDQQDNDIGGQRRPDAPGESNVIHIRAAQPELATDDRLYPRVGRRHREFERAEEIADIRD